ncbi:putative dual-specificity RNA methyltransferase RlmN [Planctomyces sp. SH-PL14]|nr:radical SAM protein [Planctomyces sp. SH-PL14]AMV20247.1 putative dual-specificity RNA methyltransferase RlmN [Planctomyces sp. SH-PL14]
MILLKDLTSDELATALADLAPPQRLVRQLHSSAVRRNATELPAEVPTVSWRLLDQIRERVAIPRLKLVNKVVSPQDGFAKYLFEGDGPGRFEAVRIPLLHRPGDEKYVVCVSSQIGCAMGCTFCATGRMGFQRNLATWEIVDQVTQVQADSPHPVRGVVFMGMGEPMLNYDRVIRAARIFSEPCGMQISGKAITISTVGIVPGIRRFTEEGHPYRLIVSLTSARSEERAKVLPVEKTYPLPELMAAVREHHAATNKRVTLAWTVLGGINTSREEAKALAELTRDLPILLDLIDVNDPTGEYRRPSGEEANAFRDALREELAAPVQRRYSGGQDIHGACGMLAAT